MEKAVVFYEKQYFKQWWLWLILLGLTGLTCYGVISQVFMGHVFGNKPMSNEGLIAIAFALIAFSIFFFTQHMLTKINVDGVYIKFRPYHKTWRFYAWSEIVSVEVKKYSPVFDYGGWGLRQGAYNVSGDMGLLLKFKNRPNLMIGTQRHEEIKEVLERLEKL